MCRSQGHKRSKDWVGTVGRGFDEAEHPCAVATCQTDLRVLHPTRSHRGRSNYLLVFYSLQGKYGVIVGDTRQIDTSRWPTAT